MKKQDGICKLCKEHKKLTFEHFPPRSAFNKNTRYSWISTEEYLTRNPLDRKHKGIVRQGGVGRYCLCRECNTFLGINYVRSYQDWAESCMYVCQKMKEKEYIEVTFMEVNPLRILKQIISIFININTLHFTNKHPELLEFVRNPLCAELPRKYKVYAYLNIEGNLRQFAYTYTNKVATIVEFAFPPIGFVLNIDNPSLLGPNERVTEITEFKNFTDSKYNQFSIGLFKNPTYSPIFLDYRTKEQLAMDMNEEQ